MHHPLLLIAVGRCEASIHVKNDEKSKYICFFAVFTWICTYGAAHSDKQQMVVHKDRRAAMLQKAGKHDDADNEFCEGRRNAFTNKGNHLFFVGGDTPAKRRYNIHRPKYHKILSNCSSFQTIRITREDPQLCDTDPPPGHMTYSGKISFAFPSAPLP